MRAERSARKTFSAANMSAGLNFSSRLAIFFGALAFGGSVSQREQTHGEIAPATFIQLLATGKH